ncbi:MULTISPECIES: hypothetical protein [Microbacterium]|uniref:Uncharacterized protein n=1 Tax=Microbacterium saccharophilum TaxID=1213358 RepID=A0A7Z7CXM9_9MICO|nr:MULTISPECIES: hypothetical protein [Microbacterium]SFI21718.1 hypothetical protein SAMN04487751_0442 [Microbacterium saccharophilum]
MNAAKANNEPQGEGEGLAGIPESDAVRKDISYSPSSERETAQKQGDDRGDLPDDIDASQVQVAPGTGGPDDAGDIDVDPDDLNMPGRG